MTLPSRRPVGLALALLLAVVLVGCNSLQLWPTPPAAERELVAGLPSKHSVPVAPFVFVSDFELPRHLPLLKELGQLRDTVSSELKLPAATTKVLVYLFEDQQKYQTFMSAKYPELPKRRAFFIAQPRRLGGSDDLMVYTYWGSRQHGNTINQDLRHELTHAILHSVLADVPIWLDEGLAEFFELPPSWNGINPAHVENLHQAGAHFDLARLEQLKDVHQMTPLEYREAWAWTHLMLRSNDGARRALLAYLRELRTNPQPGPLRPRLAAALPAPEAALDRHLSILERSTTRASAALAP